MQKKINAKAKRDIGFAANPFIDGENDLVPNESSEDEDLDPEEREKRRKFQDHKKKIEAQGFTLVTMDDVNKHRKRGRDTYGTVVDGITEEEGRKHLEKLKMREQLLQAKGEDGPGYTTQKEKRS